MCRDKYIKDGKLQARRINVKKEKKKTMKKGTLMVFGKLNGLICDSRASCTLLGSIISKTSWVEINT